MHVAISWHTAKIDQLDSCFYLFNFEWQFSMQNSLCTRLCAANSLDVHGFHLVSAWVTQPSDNKESVKSHKQKRYSFLSKISNRLFVYKRRSNSVVQRGASSPISSWMAFTYTNSVLLERGDAWRDRLRLQRRFSKSLLSQSRCSGL